jgi:uncharacterized protein (DUF58 family)
MNGKLEINFGSAVAQFERALRKFQVKKVVYQSLFRGKGLEFDGYRNFESDDDSSMIDWKASLRGNKLLAKQYVEERDLKVYFVVDVSGGMLFGSGPVLKAEYAGEIVCALSHMIMGSGDNTGLIMASGDIRKIISASKSKNQFFLIVSELNKIEGYGGKMDFDKTTHFLLNTLAKNSVVIFISDFLQVGKNFDRNLKLLATRFETLALMVRDPMDEQLPEASYQMVIQEPNSSNQIILDSDFAKVAFKRNAAMQKKFVEDKMKEARIDFLELYTRDSFINPLIAFLKQRAGAA